jgi:hypothetical protein
MNEKIPLIVSPNARELNRMDRVSIWGGCGYVDKLYYWSLMKDFI